MISPDLVNGVFELCGGFFLMNHCRALWKSKQANGVSLVSTIFFLLWGAWNCWFYPHLDQMLSFYAGLFILFANALWVSLIIYLRIKQAPGKVVLT
jgi:hypothetical protein